MRRKIIAIVLICLGCGANPVAVEDAERFCVLTREIDELLTAANDQRLTPEASQQVIDKVDDLRPLIPDEFVDDYRLRYWPATNVSGLDTSGTSTQQAYDRMAGLVTRTC